MNKQQLASRIWASANKMRSKIEANEYKDYILGFIFYKFLSDHEEQFARSHGLDDQGMKDELHETNADAVSLIRSDLGYFIGYEHLFSTWIKPNSGFGVDNVRDALNAFNRLISPSHKKVFGKIFTTLETGLGKLGDTAINQTKAIRGLLNLIQDIPMDGRQDYDVLGFVYEYLIGMFAANAGKKAGEFYTPHEVALFMAEIVANHLKDRKTIQIYDPTSGSGSLLINIGRAMSRHLNDPDKIKYYAQELKENTYNLTRMNLVMRGIKPANIEVRNGDTLERDWPYFDNENPDTTYEPLFVDAVVSNPPYSQHWSPENRESDPRYAGFGIAPKTKADYAFLLHDLYHLRDDGIMTIVLPHGVLFRGKSDDGSEGSIRRALIEGNHVSAIIGLPPNIFFGTGIPTIVMVLRKQNDREGVLIVDASRGFVKDGKKNKLRASDIKRIVDAVISRSETPSFSRLVSRAEIRANDYNLNIPRYVRTDESEHWDIGSVMFGGIPNRELDELGAYWQTFDGLREALFETRGNYSWLRGEGRPLCRPDERPLCRPDERPLCRPDERPLCRPDERPRQSAALPESVQRYIAGYVAALGGFDDYLRRELVDGFANVAINLEEQRLADEIFRRVNDLPLIDQYVAYQHLDDQWLATANDLEILQTEGLEAARKVDPKMVLKKKSGSDEEIEVQDGWQGRIIPIELMAQTRFADDLKAIAECERAAERVASELAALAGEVPDDERENLFKEDKEEFDPKSIDEVLREGRALSRPNDADGEGRALSRPNDADGEGRALSRPDDADGEGRALSRPNDADATERVPPETEDVVLAIARKAKKLIAEMKKQNSAAKKARKELEQKSIAAIEGLSDAEIPAFLELKWVKPLWKKLLDLPNEVIAELEEKVKALDKKYATTMAEVADKINAAEGELTRMMDELTGCDDDLKGLAAWREELAK